MIRFIMVYEETIQTLFRFGDRVRHQIVNGMKTSWLIVFGMEEEANTHMPRLFIERIMQPRS